MKNNENNSNNTDLKNKFFGLSVNCSEDCKMGYQDLIAKLFLHPRLTPAHVKCYLDQLEKGEVHYERLLKLANNGVQKLLSIQASGENLSEIMQDKIQDWLKTFGELSEDDWAYLDKEYALGFELLVGVDKKTAFHSPKEMAACIKQNIFGQDEAIETLSVPFFLQYESKLKGRPCPNMTSVLLIGPTGMGKSRILGDFERKSGCIVVPVNYTTLNPPQYKGLHVTDVILQKLKAERVFLENDEVFEVEERLKKTYIVVELDEIDKITGPNQKSEGENAVYERSQNCDFMRLFDSGQFLLLEDGYNRDGSIKVYRYPVDNLLVVCAGAFSGIENIVRKRLCLQNSIGFSKKTVPEMGVGELLKRVTHADLIEWGFMREFVGRIGVICAMTPLSSDMIYTIMTNAKDGFLQTLINEFREHNIDLHFTPEALQLIAEQVYGSGLGCRNLRSQLSNCMQSIYYESYNTLNKDVQTIVIDRDYIAKRLNLIEK